MKTTSKQTPRYHGFGRVLMYAKMTAALRTGATIAGAASISGCSDGTAQRYIKALEMMTPKPIHIARWEPAENGRTVVPLWVLEPGEDAPRPGGKSPAQRSRDYRHRKARIGVTTHVLNDDSPVSVTPVSHEEAKVIPNSVFALAFAMESGHGQG